MGVPELRGRVSSELQRECMEREEEGRCSA